jgi:hypothetical protein
VAAGPVVRSKRAGLEAEQSVEPAPASLVPSAPAETLTPPDAAATDPAVSGAAIEPRGPAKARAARSAAPAGAARRAHDGADVTPPPAADAGDKQLSDWGRVGQALAHGDDAAALSALQELAQSDDARTRDKADLGRAQLLLAHGNLEQGCSLARNLTHRRAGGRIERQALLLLKRCGE